MESLQTARVAVCHLVCHAITACWVFVSEITQNISDGLIGYYHVPSPPPRACSACFGMFHFHLEQKAHAKTRTARARRRTGYESNSVDVSIVNLFTTKCKLSLNRFH